MRQIALLIFSIVFFSACSTEENKWALQTFNEGGFVVNMPTHIEKSEKTEVTAFGKQVKHFVRWKPSSFAIDKFKLFEVSYTNSPVSDQADSGSVSAALDKAVELRKKDFSEVDIIQHQPIELNGYPGRAFFFDDNKGNSMVTVKMCIAGNKLYDLVVISKKNYSTNAEAAQFFDSFKLTK